MNTLARVRWWFRRTWRTVRCPGHEINEDHWATADLKIIDLWCAHCGVRLPSRLVEDLPEPMREEVRTIIANANWG